MIRAIFGVIRNYFTNTSLHGFRFVAQPGRHWSERILWIILCILSWVGSAILIKASWDAFQANAVSFVVETTYLDANTSFPSLSVCEEDHMPRVYEAMFGDDHDCNLDEVIKEITFFRGTAYYIKEFCFSDDIHCPKNNYSAISEWVRSKCPDVFEECAWMGKKIDCCKHFVPYHTELGRCFMFGSMNERELMKQNDPDVIYTESNRRSGLPSLFMALKVTAKIYMHSEVDVPFYNTMTTDILTPASNMIKKFSISVTDIENPSEVRELTVQQRKCRFPDENYLQSANYYSYSACVVECRRKEQLRVCNCTSHLMPKSDPGERCNISGLLCLNNHYAKLSVQKTPWDKKEGLICDCFPGCNDPEYNIISVYSDYISGNSSNVEIAFDRFPSERFKRNVIRGRLDLVVSMGGSAGLFVGASLLSFVEIFYFFIFRSKDRVKDEDEEKKAEKVKFAIPKPYQPTVALQRNKIVQRTYPYSNTTFLP